MDNLERAQLTVMNRKHQMIIKMAEQGMDASIIEPVLKLIDWDKEIEWAVMCYEWCDTQAAAEKAAQAAQQAQTASGS